MKLLDLLFGCWHRRYSFPQQSKRDTYVVCLSCGREFDYDWQEMKVGGERKRIVIDLEQADKLLEASERIAAERFGFSREDRRFLSEFRIRG